MSPHILALDVAGAPHRWINVRNAAHYYATDMIAWAVGQNEFVLRGGTQRATGLQSVIRASSIIAIKGKDFIVRHFDRSERLAVILYYYEQLTMREIGKVLGCSESRVSQIIDGILKRLRVYLNGREDELV